MARKATAPPSRSPRPARATARDSPSAARRQSRQVDVRGWLGGIRLSGFMVVMLGLVVLAAFVLVPTVGMYVQQRQQIAALERTVQASTAEIEELRAERERWTDPAYITTQARERLYYTNPGETLFLVLNDLDRAEVPDIDAPVSEDVIETRTDWMTQFVTSLTSAGVSETVRDPFTIGVPDAPEDAPADTPDDVPAP